jgi:hypothetical protein
MNTKNNNNHHQYRTLENPNFGTLKLHRVALAALLLNLFANFVATPRTTLRRTRKLGRLALATLILILAAGCVATPETTIRGTLNGSPFEVRAPKDGDMTGFDLVAETNGAVRLRIEHLTVKMNPDVIGQAGAAQRGLIEATGVAASNITAAAVAAALRGGN